METQPDEDEYHASELHPDHIEELYSGDDQWQHKSDEDDLKESAEFEERCAQVKEKFDKWAKDTFRDENSQPDGDPFDVLLQPLLEKDNARCKAWMEEVQSLLIFAGLFSAVVTAFVVESYKSLKEDPETAIVTLLSRIADKLDAPSGTEAPASSASASIFSPSHSDVRVNIYWFISLMLSLTVVLIGTTTLQWLREHQRYDKSLSSTDKFAIFHARQDSLRRWYVPQIFSGLPLLLQSALILFFAGVVDFLFALTWKVAVPVAISLAIPVTFFIFTTFLPTWQLFVLQFPFLLAINNSVPAQCPYRSPQSAIVWRVLTASGWIFQCCAHVFSFFYMLCIVIPGDIKRFIARIAGQAHLCYQKCRKLIPRSTPYSNDLYNAPILVTLRGCGGFTLDAVRIRRIADPQKSSLDWSTYDLPWLATRTSYKAITNEVQYPLSEESLRNFNDDDHILPAMYDCSEGLRSLMPSLALTSHCTEIHLCFEQLSLEQLALWKPFLSTPDDVLTCRALNLIRFMGASSIDPQVANDMAFDDLVHKCANLDPLVLHAINLCCSTRMLREQQLAMQEQLKRFHSHTTELNIVRERHIASLFLLSEAVTHEVVMDGMILPYSRFVGPWEWLYNLSLNLGQLSDNYAVVTHCQDWGGVGFVLPSLSEFWTFMIIPRTVRLALHRSDFTMEHVEESTLTSIFWMGSLFEAMNEHNQQDDDGKTHTIKMLSRGVHTKTFPSNYRLSALVLSHYIAYTRRPNTFQNTGSTELSIFEKCGVADFLAQTNRFQPESWDAIQLAAWMASLIAGDRNAPPHVASQAQYTGDLPDRMSYSRIWSNLKTTSRFLKGSGTAVEKEDTLPDESRKGPFYSRILSNLKFTSSLLRSASPVQNDNTRPDGGPNTSWSPLPQ